MVEEVEETTIEGVGDTVNVTITEVADTVWATTWVMAEAVVVVGWVEVEEGQAREESAEPTRRVRDFLLPIQRGEGVGCRCVRM